MSWGLEVKDNDSLNKAILLDLEELATQKGPASAKTVVRDRSSRVVFQRGIMNSVRGTWGSTPIFQPKSLAPGSDIKSITINDIYRFALEISANCFDSINEFTEYAAKLELANVIDDTNHGVLNCDIDLLQSGIQMEFHDILPIKFKGETDIKN